MKTHACTELLHKKHKKLFPQGFAKEIAARYNRDPYNMLEKIGHSLLFIFTIMIIYDFLFFIFTK